MKQSYISLICLSFLVIPTVNGAIKIQETFGYSPGTTLGANETGGQGFAGGYTVDAALTTSPSTTVVNTTDFPGGLSTLNVGVPLNNIGTIGGGDANRALGSGAFTNDPATPTTLYVSFTYRSDGTTGGARFGFSRGLNRTLEFRQIGSFEMRALWSQAGGSTLGNTAQTTATYGNAYLFVVARLDFGSAGGDDRIRFTVYEAGGTIPLAESWDVDSGFFTMQGGTLDQIYFDAGGSNNRFGNIRVGDSYEDVTFGGADAVTLEESFDYAPGTILSASDTGGIGFSGGYHADDALTTSPTTMEVNTTNFSGALGTLNVAVPVNDIGTLGGSASHRGLGSGAFDSNPLSPTTLYLSFTYKSDGVAGGARIGFGRGATETMEFRQVGAGGPIRALWSQVGGSTLGNNADTPLSFGDEFLFVVARLDFGSAGGDDRIRFSVYQADGTIVDDDSWQVDSGLFSMQDGTLDQLYIDSGGANTRFGNIRMGTSFKSVTGVAATAAEAPLINIGISGATVSITFDSVNGVNYQLESSTSLSGWSDVTGQSASGDGTQKELTDSVPNAGESAFYRVRAQ